MKQTAVEWLVSQLNKPGFTEVVTDEEIQKAKEMEKKQIVKFSKVVLKEYKWIRPEELSTIKRLYNETFNSNEK
jgi:hypothetical protein